MDPHPGTVSKKTLLDQFEKLVERSDMMNCPDCRAQMNLIIAMIRYNKDPEGGILVRIHDGHLVVD